MKQSGILLHVTSLKTDFGIGDIGPAAYHFADFLAANGYSIWQILPLNFPGYGNSPYNPISAFAFNEYLISPQLLVECDLLLPQELIELPLSSTVDYEAVHTAKDIMNAIAAERFLQRNDIQRYIEDHATIMKPYLSFIWLCKRYGNSAWYTWDEQHRRYQDTLYDQCKEDPDVQKAAALQRIFCDQMRALKSYLEAKGILLFGDMPLYLGYESAEVWANPHLFDLDSMGRRLSLAGVPPDAFATQGQLWGNPIYNWISLRDSGFELFLDRIRHTLQFIDLLRLDHFIGYVNYWKVPSPDGIIPNNAQNGSWEQALPREFFHALKVEFGTERFVAEDLGILNTDVCDIRDELGFPGMIILQFCFEERIPRVQNFPPDRLIYTGTHDNNTSRGWWDNLPQDSESRKNMAEYCRLYLDGIIPDSDNIAGIMLQIATQSACHKMIFPMQDVLGLGSEARMNIPGTALGNWQWRFC